VNNFDELVSRAAGRLFFGVCIDKVRADVVLEYDSQQAVHRATTARDLLQHVCAASLLFERRKRWIG
jgi:hypothetical protein